jgi:hypothetical protein
MRRQLANTQVMTSQLAADDYLGAVSSCNMGEDKAIILLRLAAASSMDLVHPGQHYV